MAITKPQTIVPDQTESFMAILNLDNQTSLRTKDIRGLAETTEENLINLTGNAKDGCCEGPFLALVPHDIQELTISPSQEGENPSSSFLRIYMSNIPEPPKEEEEDPEEGHHHCEDEECDCHHHHHDHNHDTHWS